MRSSKKSRKNKCWITSGIKKSISVKHKLYKKWILSENHTDELNFKNYAKSLKKILNRAEKDFYNCILDSKFNSIKGIWSVLNNLCNPRYLSRVPKQSVNKLIINNNVITDERKISESFNEYFCNIGNNLASKLPNMGDDFKTYLPSSVANSFFLF